MGHRSNELFVVCFLLGNSPESEFYMPTFRNTLFHLHRRIVIKDGCGIFRTIECLLQFPPLRGEVFLISNFYLVLNIACLLLGNSPESEFYMPTFRNTLSVHSSSADMYELFLL